MDCCVGDIPINFGTWYGQNGKSPDECTYCEYCIRNKCIDVSQTYKLADSTIHSTCDCPKKNSHIKLFCYLCPKCEMNRFTMNNSEITEGKCRRCNFEIPCSSFSYCQSCSIQFKSCYECGYPIKDGNTCITEIELAISKQVQEIKNYMINEKDEKYMQFHIKNIEMLTSQLQKARELFANKTSDQMCALLVDIQRKKHFQMMQQYQNGQTNFNKN